MITELLFSNIDKIHTGIGDRLSVFFQWTSSFVAGIVIGFVFDWRLTLVMLATIPFMVVSAAYFLRVSNLCLYNMEQFDYINFISHY